MDEEEKPNIDPEFEEVTEGEELEEKEELKTKWAQLEAVVGADNRVRQIAEDILEHFDARLEQMDGKAMVVCMSRRICVELYSELVRLRPEWEDNDDTKGEIKVAMTGSASDPVDWQKHIRSKSGRETLANRFRDPDDPFRVVLVRDMWLTGFDAPSLHTMYVDKPMQGHGLFQAITRVKCPWCLCDDWSVHNRSQHTLRILTPRQVFRGGPPQPFSPARLPLSHLSHTDSQQRNNRHRDHGHLAESQLTPPQFHQLLSHLHHQHAWTPGSAYRQPWNISAAAVVYRLTDRADLPRPRC